MVISPITAVMELASPMSPDHPMLETFKAPGKDGLVLHVGGDLPGPGGAADPGAPITGTADDAPPAPSLQVHACVCLLSQPFSLPPRSGKLEVLSAYLALHGIALPQRLQLVG